MRVYHTVKYGLQGQAMVTVSKTAAPIIPPVFSRFAYPSDSFWLCAGTLAAMDKDFIWLVDGGGEGGWF